jgi:hypothetical protein
MRFILILLAPTIVFADCQSLIRACFLKDKAERSACLDSAIREKECSEPDVVSLIQDRLALTGVGYENEDSLSIDTVDHACIKSFDEMLSLELIKGPLGASSIASLKEKLSGCVQRASIDLFRL